MKFFFALTFSFLFLFSCEFPKQPDIEDMKTAPISTYYLIRHAEKDRSNPAERDPELTEEGAARAVRWAQLFRDITFDEIYTTDYKRTRQTAHTVSVQSEVKLTPYDANRPYSEDFQERTTGKTVLVVGHSNTTPAFVNAIIGEERFSDLPDDDNGSLFIVTKVGNESTVQHLHVD
ncbi:SixA phosphatase family protein [Luteirhabdus pelagi]|uniref:SixA phosphatase family protein n=1 Tax=Luteirhabdus pelagi TaxID=2792783 RepID=UPI00193ACA4E|nr:phosphoglycerate mutase family protein [Luteirhabdus pelagi]